MYYNIWKLKLNWLVWISLMLRTYRYQSWIRASILLTRDSRGRNSELFLLSSRYSSQSWVGMKADERYWMLLAMGRWMEAKVIVKSSGLVRFTSSGWEKLPSAIVQIRKKERCVENTFALWLVNKARYESRLKIFIRVYIVIYVRNVFDDSNQ